MKIYTRTGDLGTTALFGGDRVSKTHPRIAVYGTVDEACSFIGVARSFIEPHPYGVRIDELLARIQADLFVLGADLATPPSSRTEAPRITSSHAEALEREIDRLEEELPPLKRFVLPGGCPAGAALHVARTVCRRAERLAIEASETEDLSQTIVVYLNRLSDLLFVAARWTNHQARVPEHTWAPEM